MIDLEEWLRANGCGGYIEAFRENGITADLLTELTDADLRELGLTMGDRKRVMRAIAALGPMAPEVPSAPARPRSGQSAHAERRQLTVMFVDLIGSTGFANRLDPEIWSEVIREYQNAVAGVVTRFGGYIAQYLGDGILCYFGWPQAFEDSVSRAIRAGLEVNEVVAKVTADGEALSCRVGAATGLVVVGELIGQSDAMENIAIGDTPNLAARLQEVAKPGQVVVSEATRRLIGSAFEIETLGPRQFKGLPEAQEVFAVIGPAKGSDRFAESAGAKIVEMVGRDQELALLSDRWRRSCIGDGQAVLLLGEAGIGKSRVCRALFESIDRGSYYRVRYQCSPYHSDTALWPVIHQLTNSAEIATAHSSEEKLDRLETLLGQAGTVTDKNMALLGELLGLDVESRYGSVDLAPSARRAATFTALREQILGLARRKPVMLFIEDLHWCDPTTLEMISVILDHMDRERVMILMTSRPENKPEFLPHPHFTTLSLNRLTRAGVEQIVTRLGGDKLPAATITAIIERTDGVPLFVEELTKALIESGEVAVPASLHDTLMARLDRLPEVKEIAQIASVMGREFEADPLAQVAALSQQRVVTALEDLRQVELVFPRGGKFGRYIFKHALVRDAAYQSLLNRRRQEIHGRIFDVLRENDLTMPGILAHHAAEAGRLTDAVKFGRMAAEEALRRPAYAEAITHLETAIGTLSLQDDSESARRQRVRLLLLAGEARIAHSGYAAQTTVATYAEIERIARQIGDKVLLIEGLYGRWAGHYVPGRNPIALSVADEILDVSLETEDTLAQALGHRLRGTVLTMMGDVARASEALDRGRQLYNPAIHARYAARFGQDVGNAGECYRIGVQMLTGRLDSAARLAREVLQATEQLDHPHTTAYVMGHLALFLCAGEIEPFGVETAERCIDFSERNRLPLWAALGHASRSMAAVYRGQGHAALPELRQALDTLEVLKFDVFRPMLLPAYAIALTDSGEEGALEAIAEAKTLVEDSNARFAEAEILRAEGTVAHRAGDLARAKECFEKAMARARSLGHLTWELRAAEAMLPLLEARGESGRARSLIADVHVRFLEGGDLPALRRAANLIAVS